jgi:hypothetical protein
MFVLEIQSCSANAQSQNGPSMLDRATVSLGKQRTQLRMSQNYNTFAP